MALSEKDKREFEMITKMLEVQIELSTMGIFMNTLEEAEACISETYSSEDAMDAIWKMGGRMSGSYLSNYLYQPIEIEIEPQQTWAFNFRSRFGSREPVLKDEYINSWGITSDLSKIKVEMKYYKRWKIQLIWFFFVVLALMAIRFGGW